MYCSRPFAIASRCTQPLTFTVPFSPHSRLFQSAVVESGRPQSMRQSRMGRPGVQSKACLSACSAIRPQFSYIRSVSRLISTDTPSAPTRRHNLEHASTKTRKPCAPSLFCARALGLVVVVALRKIKKENRANRQTREIPKPQSKSLRAAHGDDARVGGHTRGLGFIGYCLAYERAS